MALYAHRQRFARLSTALGSALAGLPLSANGWTLLGVGAAVATAFALARGRLLGAALLYGLSGLCDLIDGAVARQRGTASARGAYLDTLADRLSEGAALFGLLLVPLPPLGLEAHHWLFLYLFLSLMVTYAKAAASEKGLVEKEFGGGGWLERPERVIILSAGMLAGGLRLRLVTLTLALLTILAAASLLQRVRLVLAEHARSQGRS